MMGNDWDLYEIVRSCAGAGEEGSLNHDSFSLPIFVHTRINEHDDDPFGKIFTTAPSAAAAAAAAAAGGLGERLPLVQSLQQPQPQILSSKDRNDNNSVGFRAQASRRRRRKKQIKVKVRMKVETLSKALRSWRKYGQKPIKGSPHPRSYYRCRRSEACAAKKQVELSHDNPGEYIVSYIGIHTHGRPAALGPTAGTTGNPLLPCSTSTATAVVTYPTPTSTAPIIPSPDEDNQLKYADDVILIPNNQIAEELFMAMHGFKSTESQSPAKTSLYSGRN